MKKEKYIIYLTKSLGFFEGRMLEIKCDGMTLSYPDRIQFYNFTDSEKRYVIAEFERNEIMGWKQKI